MPNKVKVDLNYANSLVGSGADRATFINEISSKYNVTKQYASLLYYKLRGKLAPANPQVQQPQVQQPQKSVEIISPKSVEVKNTAPNDEASDLKKAYSKLFQEKTEDSPIDIEPESDGFGEPTPPQSADEPTDEFANAEEAEKNFKLKLGALLKQIGVAVNNNLIWKERHLDSMEIDNIEDASKDIEMSFGDGLEGPYSPYYNYLIFAIIAPAIARADLIPEKIKGLTEWLKSMRGSSPMPYQNARVQQEPPVNQPQQQEQPQQQQGKKDNRYVYSSELSPAQKMMVDNLIAQGYQVEPGFNPNLPIDYEAYSNKIARNKIIRI